MPALITHNFFGQDVYDRLFGTIGGTQDEAQAFLLGNQGPDPLFYSIIYPSLREHNRLGHVMHNEKPSELLKAFKDSLAILDEDELPAGRAYAFGFLCHYTLDSVMHPFIYFNEYRLCDAGEPGLSRADGNEVHAVIESELDEMMLFTRRNETVATFLPWREILQADDQVLAIVSKQYAYVALVVYGRIIPPDMFARSVQGFRSIQKLFHSPTGRKRAVIGRLERLFRPHSFYQSMSHRPLALTESVYDNRAHEPWENPFTGAISTDGFQDRYDQALEKALAAVESFDRIDFNLDTARALTGELDFSGRPVVATVVSVEDPSTDDSTVRKDHAPQENPSHAAPSPFGTASGTGAPA